MTLDIIYLAWNRLEFTKKSWEHLLANTNWDLVRALYVYVDGDVDGEEDDGTGFWLSEQIRNVPTLGNFLKFKEPRRSPVRIMNEYLDQSIADLFAKLDNDIVMPPYWLDIMVDVMENHPELELLGAEASMGEMLPIHEDPEAVWVHGWHTYLEARHVGGVGLFRTSAFLTRPRIRPNGRFGFTEWQHEQQPKAGWIRPDLLMCDLSRIPVAPWTDYAAEYVKKGWQRKWPQIDGLRSFYWDWWTKGEAT